MWTWDLGIGDGVGLVLFLAGWVLGATFGLLLSLPDAIITKAYGHILVPGAIGGALIGGLIHGWS